MNKHHEISSITPSVAVSEMESNLTELSNKVDTLKIVVGSLDSKLSPVIYPDSPDSPEEACDEPISGHPIKVINTLVLLKEEISAIISHVEDINSRLPL